FELWAVDPPALEAVPGRARPGDTIRLTGRLFGPVAEHHRVLFGGARARVLAGTATTLDVEVPPCLPPGPTGVRSRLGAQASQVRTVWVDPGRGPAELEPGGALELRAHGAGDESCRALGPGEYLVAIGSTGDV